MAEKYINFTGEIRNLQRKNDFLFDVTLYLVNDSLTRNGWRFTDMEGHKNQFLGTPILVAYEFGQVGSGHNSTRKIDPETGKEYLSYTGSTDERIIGSMSEDPNDIWTEVDAEGRTWIVGKGTIWKWYAKEAVDKIEKDTAEGKPMSLSIEALVEEFHMEDGIEIEDAYKILGTTLLGPGVQPAVPGAHIKALSEDSGFNELKLRAASFIDTPDTEGDKEELPVEPKTKPQKNNSEKESSTLKAFSKKQLAALSVKFEGYNVVAAGQNENGIHVCLMSADGGTSVYTMDSVDATIAPEKIMRNNAQVSFEFGEDVVQVDCCDITDRLSGSLIEAEAKIAKLSADLESANETIKEMNAIEAKRRIKAAKAMAESALNAFNANREEKVEKEILNSVLEAIDRGEYSECVDAEGCWTGEEVVSDAVLAKCAKAQIELDKLAAQKKNSFTSWSAYGAENGEPEGLSALIAKFGK